jgi:RNA polymerase sigma-70 factor (subfamily 1)
MKGGLVPSNPDAVNKALEKFRAYLDTLTFIQIDPRLRSKFGWSDIVQETLIKASRGLERIEAMDSDDQKRLLRRMLVNSLLDEIDRWRTAGRDVGHEQSLDEAAAEGRLRGWLAVEDTPPGDRLVRQEEALRLLEALSNLDPRYREALILQKYHGWTLAQIAERMDCTTGAVAGYHARGLNELRKLLPELE